MENKKKVFIVDDDEVALESLKQLLVVSGFDVELTQDAREVLEKAKRGKPDIILLDLRMPHVGGFEICEMLNQDAQTKDIPIIITSALADFADIKKAYLNGVISYFTKPYDFKKLLQEINKIIAAKERTL
ncbi:MAG: hypothetical protein A2Y00_02385 [Omnitrophica WOR_2 bacterium GWF2_43_52]|nr:MAG: hypothetical protein A2062_01725 [Omnitrophica WOR_2 bacterium GWA2_44_7]OGX20289.1 MAG: hypothetical protein A2Y00_02385 [Omnitrophica WOR_2 bacterium GWF2_43_52]OGX56390.1 MAG: hypothetical protein A2460_01845 [Omnitrophica WOR_2 bacterium RIFOXYC2_FULL_43_9]HAH21282.1 hypothetical protein [Candidatus Omnitrophota bacterium]HBG63906.1 hypothetical protein [Candidatus Omnitrophota bacterium]